MRIKTQYVALIYVVNNAAIVGKKEIIEQVDYFIRLNGNTGLSFASIVISRLECRLFCIYISSGCVMALWHETPSQYILKKSYAYCLE